MVYRRFEPPKWMKGGVRQASCGLTFGAGCTSAKWRPHQVARARHGDERKLTVTATAGSTAGTAHTVIETRLGPITLIRSGANLTGLYYQRHWPRPDRAAFGPLAGDGFAGAGVARDVFAAAASQLGEYLDGDRTEFELPVRADGSEFEQRVWALVAGIPYGQTTSYGELARRLGAGTDPRDVGRGRRPQPAVHRDPVSPGGRQHGQAHRLRGRPEPQARIAGDRARPAGAVEAGRGGRALVGRSSPTSAGAERLAPPRRLAVSGPARRQADARPEPS